MVYLVAGVVARLVLLLLLMLLMLLLAVLAILYWPRMFLTPAELRDMTGYKNRSAQIRWLTDHGFRFVVNGLGQLIVAVAEMERKLVGGSPRPKSRQEPNWAAINEPLGPKPRLPKPKARS